MWCAKSRANNYADFFQKWMVVKLTLDMVEGSQDGRWGLNMICTLSPVSKLNCLQSPSAVGGSDCSELVSSNICVHAADVYLALQLG